MLRMQVNHFVFWTNRQLYSSDTTSYENKPECRSKANQSWPCGLQATRWAASMQLEMLAIHIEIRVNRVEPCCLLAGLKSSKKDDLLSLSSGSSRHSSLSLSPTFLLIHPAFTFLLSLLSASPCPPCISCLVLSYLPYPPRTFRFISFANRCTCQSYLLSLHNLI